MRPTWMRSAGDAWRERAHGRFAQDSMVVVWIIIIAVLGVRIVRQPVDIVNGLSTQRRTAVALPTAPPVVAAVAPPSAALPPHATSTTVRRAAAAPAPRRTAVERVAAGGSVRPAAPPPAPSQTAMLAASSRLPGVELAPEIARDDAVTAVVVPSDRSSIERVLEAYRSAYEQLDASSAAAVWPGVDARALTRAFRALAEQDVSFDSCQLDIGGANANARCVGAIRYVGRVGDQVPRVRRLAWSFALERVSDRWQIAQVATHSAAGPTRR